MFDSFDLSDFGFGIAMPFTGPTPGVVTSGSQATVVPAGTPWYQTLATLGLDGFKSWLNFDLGQQQVKAGQLPSQNATVGNLAAQTVNSISAYLPLLLIVLLLVGGYKLLFGRR